MFLNCINLSAAPQFATTIPVQKAQYCYKGMFWNCSSLVNVPNLPATNIASGNYQNMFWNCTSLVSPPSLNYITISQPSSFQGMFMGCSNLKYCQDINIPTIQICDCNNLVKGCQNLIIPPSINANVVNEQGCYAMFSGCSSLKYIPPLLPTTLNNQCYREMFNGCIQLVSDQTYLPATELAPSCYYEMFKNNNINFITVKFTDWNTSNFSTTNWLVNNKAQNLRGTFQCYDVLDLNVRGDSGIPTNWEINLNGNISKLIFNDNIVAGSLQLFYLRKK